MRFKGHNLRSAPFPVIPPGEGDLSLINFHYAVIGYAGTVGVAGEIIQDFFSSRKRRFCIDHSFTLTAFFIKF